MSSKRLLIDRAGNAIADGGEDSLFVAQLDGIPMEELMAVGHMGSWNDFDQTIAILQDPVNSTGIKANREPESIGDGDDVTNEPEATSAVDILDNFEIAYKGNGEAEVHAALDAFFGNKNNNNNNNNNSTKSDEASLEPMPFKAEMAQHPQHEDTKTIYTKESNTPEHWRKWTAIHLVSLHIY